MATILCGLLAYKPLQREDVNTTLQYRSGARRDRPAITTADLIVGLLGPD